MNLTAIRLTERNVLPLLVLGLYVLVGLFFLQEYLLWDSQWLLALVLVPLVAQVQTQKSLSPVLLIAATALAILAASLHNSTLYFFAFLVAVWCGIQLILGRISLYPLLLLTVASPIFKYLANIISFPLRMQLTDLSVLVLRAMQKEAEAAGNIILVDGEEFSVDPACAGLSMLSLSLILGVFILAHLQRTRQKVWPVWSIGLMLALMLLLNLMSNLLRILLLVWFKILPGNPLHDLLGLLCLLAYAIVPFFFLAKQLQQRVAIPACAPVKTSSISLRGSLLLNYLLLLLLTGIGISINRERPLLPMAQFTPQLPGFEKERLANGVTKYSSPDALVYLKPVQAFYSTEHHPLICWEGSGYKFRRVRQHQIGNDTIYVGELQKGADILYTAWWMDNGQHLTIDQWDWRWRMLKGEAKFQLMNVTVEKQAELPQAIDKVMKQSAGRGITALPRPKASQWSTTYKPS